MLASLRCQTPSTRRFAPVPETRTLEKPNARNFLAISALSAKRSTELRARVAQYRFPFSILLGCFGRRSSSKGRTTPVENRRLVSVPPKEKLFGPRPVDLRC